ncbi:MAG: lysylphosphatidylglycerol synthase transmembrane domain-containing protein, partial [Chitinophagaceae bacterium]
MRGIKNIKIFVNYFLGPLLFLWLCYSIYSQVTAQQHLGETWRQIAQVIHSPQIGYGILAVLLMFVNWGLEAAKWKLSVSDIHPVSFIQAYKAVLSGVSISVTTPNRVGEYLGRMMYLPEGNRLKVIAVTLIGSCSQLLVTFAAGAAGLLILKDALIGAGLINPVFYEPVWLALCFVILILTLFYFNLPAIEKWIETLLKRRSWLYLIQAVQAFGTARLFALLLLSGGRYCTFVLQYILLFNLFGVRVPALTLFWLMSLVFLALAIIPTIAVVVEFGVRGEVCLLLVGLFTTNSLGIVLTSVTIWLINLIIPALIGSLLILSIRVFKQREKAGQK